MHSPTQQLADWGKAIADATKEKKIGLPAGPNGLMHRLTQGYLYPAYTGGLVTTYRSPDAVTMWTDLKNIWQYCNPQSTSYNFMQDPLLTEEVWIGWDHTARLGTAFAQKPEDFIAVPAPSGPKGLYYMSVLAGLGIPKNSPNQVGAEAFIELYDHAGHPNDHRRPTGVLSGSRYWYARKICRHPPN